MAWEYFFDFEFYKHTKILVLCKNEKNSENLKVQNNRRNILKC